MKEHPILFSSEMVNAILEGRKTQTRRIVKGVHPDARSSRAMIDGAQFFDGTIFQKYLGYALYSHGAVGDRLWVRETWQDLRYITDCKPDKLFTDEHGIEHNIIYRANFKYDDDIAMLDADGNDSDENGNRLPMKWKPSIFMPRWASRITLEITNIRVERLQDITEEDARAEGIRYSEESQDFDDYSYDNKNADAYGLPTAKQSFQSLWDKINGKRASWESNPWVWVIEFKKVEGANKQ